MPKIARNALDMLGCGVGIWTMQAFEHRNKENKHACSSKTNGKRNYYEHVLKAMHHMFLNKKQIKHMCSVTI